MFTIEVKKKDKDEGFTFKDLEMLHQECHGGTLVKLQATALGEYDTYKLSCRRCGASIRIHQDTITGTIATSIDGKERKFTEEPRKHIKIVQKS